jgi:hydrogenase maturation protease
MSGIRVVGMGSPHGDDQAGWRLVEMLENAVDATVLSDPGRLLDHVDGCEKLILVDACRSGLAPGTIVRLTWHDASLRLFAGRSTHSLGVGAVLALAETLRRLPPAVVLFAVEAESCEPGEQLSPAVSEALPELCRRVWQEMSESACQKSEVRSQRSEVGIDRHSPRT